MKIEHSQLGRFVGQWNTEGLINATDDSPAIKVQGTDTYEWLPGEFFLLHRVNVSMGKEKNETLEIIGNDPENNTCLMHYYDNKGNSGSMTATCDGEVWCFAGKSLRFTGGFSKNDKEFSGVWEQSADGKNWANLMNIKLSRAK